MTEELKTKACAMLIDLLNEAATAKEFLKGEVPEIAEQLISWHLTHSLLYFSLGVFMLLVAAILLGVAFKLRAWGSNTPEYSIHLSLLSTIPCVVGALVCISSLSWLQIIIAPKLYLLEYIRGL